MQELWQLFVVFARIGAVSFGGGYAMLPILTREFVDQRGWVTDTELTDYYAISQCTPGVIAVNVATFIGNKRKGWIGGIFATIGLVSIPVVVLLIIAAFLTNFADYAVVKDAFAGIRVCVCVLILNAILRLWKSSVLDGRTLVLFLAVFLLSALSSLSPILLVLAAGLAGLLLRHPKKTKGDADS